MSSKKSGKEPSNGNIDLAPPLRAIYDFTRLLDERPGFKPDTAVIIPALEWMMKNYSQTQKIVGFLEESKDIGNNSEIKTKDFWRAVKNIELAENDRTFTKNEQTIAMMFRVEIESLRDKIEHIKPEQVTDRTPEYFEHRLLKESKKFLKTNAHIVARAYGALGNENEEDKRLNTRFARNTMSALIELLSAESGTDFKSLLQLPENLENLQKFILDKNNPQFRAEQEAYAEYSTRKTQEEKDAFAQLQKSDVFTALVNAELLSKNGKELFAAIDGVNKNKSPRWER